MSSKHFAILTVLAITSGGILATLFARITAPYTHPQPTLIRQNVPQKRILRHPLKGTSARQQNSVTDSHTSDFYRTIVDNNLFRPLGWTPPRPREPYRLIGTILPTDKNTPKQAILARTTTRRTYTVRIGETLDTDTTIVDIQPKQVTLEKAGVRRTLHLNTIPLLK